MGSFISRTVPQQDLDNAPALPCAHWAEYIREMRRYTQLTEGVTYAVMECAASAWIWLPFSYCRVRHIKNE
jgi:hypothetical protein